MFRFIEKSFLKITQILGLLFATIVLVVAVIVSYNKIDVKADDKIDRDDITEILLKVTLNTLILTNNLPKLIS
jgi:preprotein translocase subunit SecG